MTKVSEIRSYGRRAVLTKAAQLMQVGLRDGVLRRIHKLVRNAPSVGFKFQRIPPDPKRGFVAEQFSAPVVRTALKKMQADKLLSALHEQNWNIQYAPENLRHGMYTANVEKYTRVKRIAELLKSKLAPHGGDDLVSRLGWATGANRF